MSVSDLLASTTTGVKPWTALSVQSVTVAAPVIQPNYEILLQTTTPVSIPNSTATTILFAAPVSSPGWTYVAGTGIATCAKAGLYLATATGEIAGTPAAGGGKTVTILKNGTAVATQSVATAVAANTLATCIVNCVRPVRFAVGDTAAMQVAQSSGAAANSPSTGFNSLELTWMHE